MPMKNTASTSPIGHRIHITGNSCSGKSTLGQQLANLFGISFVDLDAINWQPNWVGLSTTNKREFEHRMVEATEGDAWVVAGSYMQFSQNVFWPRLHTVIWLDLPRPKLVIRLLIRSWKRWRSKELLWGTNQESFLGQLMVWRKNESLLYWIITQHQIKRDNMLQYMTDLRFTHIRFIRLTTISEIEAFTQSLKEIVKKDSL